MPHLPELQSAKDELDTPALCLDLDVMDANIRAVAATCKTHGVDWRPHAKCHKSSWIAQRLVAAGAIGVTCAKLGEAEVMAAAGVRDLLIANLVVGQQKLDRLAALATAADVMVCVDGIEQAAAISDVMWAKRVTVRLLVEVDIGLQRVGVQPLEPALRLAQQIVDLPGVRLAGIMAYEGHLLTVEDQAEKSRSIRSAISRATKTRELLEQSGIRCPIMSCGGTGSFVHTVSLPGVTEIQAGGAIFMDAFYRHMCHVDNLQYAVTVVSTVVSRPSPDRAVIDAGRKTLNAEIFMPRVVGREDLELKSLSAEHGILTVHPSPRPIAVGQRVELVPGYVDLTVNLHDHLLGIRNQRLERIIPIEARGLIR